MKWEKLDLILKMLGYPSRWRTQSMFHSFWNMCGDTDLSGAGCGSSAGPVLRRGPSGNRRVYSPHPPTTTPIRLSIFKPASCGIFIDKILFISGFISRPSVIEKSQWDKSECLNSVLLNSEPVKSDFRSSVSSNKQSRKRLDKKIDFCNRKLIKSTNSEYSHIL